MSVRGALLVFVLFLAGGALALKPAKNEETQAAQQPVKKLYLIAGKKSVPAPPPPRYGTG